MNSRGRTENEVQASAVHGRAPKLEYQIAFTDKSVLLRTQVSGLTDLIARQEANLLGRAEQKNREETELETIAHELNQSLAGYYAEKRMEARSAEIDLSLSAWRRLRDAALLAKATLLKNSLAAAPADFLNLRRKRRP